MFPRVFILFLTLGITPSLGLMNLGPSHLASQTERLTNPVQGDVGLPLILTPYIETGDIETARNLSSVAGGPFSNDVLSFSGYFTVNKDYNSNLFVWFFPAQNNYENAPVILWLEGGPGTSGLFTLFNEFGPYFIKDDLSLRENPYSWHRNYSVIFVDNPVGTGFSFTNNDTGYAEDETQVGTELYTMLIQFFKIFSELQTLPFYIAGESYGGKYVPALGHAIHQLNPTAELKLNLQGLMVGNGLTDPINMVDYSTLLYELGLVDTNTYQRMHSLEDECRQATQEGNYVDAYNTLQQVLLLLFSSTHYTSYFNFLYPDMPPQMSMLYMTFVEQPEVRAAIHVGDSEYSDGSTVRTRMIPDIMVSVKPWLEELLDNYRVMYYSGQLDIVVAYAFSVNMYNNLQFGAAQEYKKAERLPWYVNGELAGYTKTAGNFTEVLVRNAGHIVAVDQPAWLLDLISKFISSTLVL
ncbi:venom serine carboxypeptidase-like [Periplaneta americana]|uniref:venom serine carboxypeptidase-like n=1 Tax=Periplaneta americana TaxID=6978 RepID=UPI0037E71FF0